MKSINNSKGFIGLLLILLVVVLLAGVIYDVKTGLVNTPVVTPPVETPLAQEENKVHVVDFTYTVKSTTGDVVVLTGKGSNMTLMKDPSIIITVYKGATSASPKMELNQLKVGDKLNAEFVPGKSITLFVVSTL
jgi:hypothetical protein